MKSSFFNHDFTFAFPQILPEILNCEENSMIINFFEMIFQKN